MLDILQREVFPALSQAMATPLEAPPIWLYALVLLAIIIATTVHEFGHAWMAAQLGDPGPREAGRVTLNPFKHFDALGFLLMAVTLFIGFPLGWGRPVKTDPSKYRCGEKQGVALVAFAGPAMNFLTAAALAPLARFLLSGGMGEGPLAQILAITLVIVMLVNLSLFCFNLVPIHPLDGSHILASLLPEELSKPYRVFMQRFGVYLLLILMYTRTLGEFIAPIVLRLFLWLIGL